MEVVVVVVILVVVVAVDDDDDELFSEKNNSSFQTKIFTDLQLNYHFSSSTEAFPASGFDSNDICKFVASLIFITCSFCSQQFHFI